MRHCGLALFVMILSLLATMSADGGTSRTLKYAPAPVDNPLKGLVPYQGDRRKSFPHSLEFNYIAYSALVQDYDAFDWSPLERMLDDMSSRGHQAVLRVYLEYPGKKGAIPPFLIRDGLTLHRTANEETPDYENTNLRRSLRSFIAAFGRKYDGDPRIGFLTAGLLGAWGEWHTFPRSELFASKTVQQEVLDAYETAFKTTPVLLRYPAGADDDRMESNARRKFGYHDDSFAWATLHTGKRDEEWFFMTLLTAAGPEAVARWKTCPIGGEIRPEAWGQVFDARPARPQIQDFRECVTATHASWLLDSGMFEKPQSAARVARALEQVRAMGYEFHVPEVTLHNVSEGQLKISMTLENRGGAPFYYDWKPQFGLLAKNQPAATFPGTGSLVGLLPNDPPRTWEDCLALTGVRPGKYLLAVRVPNPLKTGQPLRFANQEQDRDAAGWLSLGEVNVP